MCSSDVGFPGLGPGPGTGTGCSYDPPPLGPAGFLDPGVLLRPPPSGDPKARPGLGIPPPSALVKLPSLKCRGHRPRPGHAPCTTSRGGVVRAPLDLEIWSGRGGGRAVFLCILPLSSKTGVKVFPRRASRAGFLCISFVKYPKSFFGRSEGPK